MIIREGDYIMVNEVLIKIVYVYRSLGYCDGYNLLDGQCRGGSLSQCRPVKPSDFNEVYKVWLEL